MQYRTVLFLSFAVGLVACGSFVDVVDVNTVPTEERSAAAHVQIYMAGQKHNANFTYIGAVEAYSCKNKLWDKPASQADSLEQLRIKAYRMRADAVSDVTCTMSGTDAYGTNCWNAVQCGGTAIKE